MLHFTDLPLAFTDLFTEFFTVLSRTFHRPFATLSPTFNCPFTGASLTFHYLYSGVGSWRSPHGTLGMYEHLMVIMQAVGFSAMAWFMKAGPWLKAGGVGGGGEDGEQAGGPGSGLMEGMHPL